MSGIEPCETPHRRGQIQPIADDLLSVIAIQAVEIDSLRLQCNLSPFGQRRVFTAKDLQNGRSLGPNAMFTDPDTLVVRLES
jgi:hypothetical protein